MRVVITTCAVTLTLLVLHGAIIAAPPTEKKEKSRADRVQVSPTEWVIADDGTQTITVALNIDKGWMIYSNTPGIDDLEDVRTVLCVSGERNVEQLRVEYPAGVEIKNKLIGAYKIYTDSVVVRAKIRRLKGDRLPVTLTSQYYPTDGRTCGVVEKKTIIIEYPSN